MSKASWGRSLLNSLMITLANDQLSTWALIDRKLMLKGSDLWMKRKAATKPAYQQGDGKGDKIFHGRKPWGSILKIQENQSTRLFDTHSDLQSSLVRQFSFS